MRRIIILSIVILSALSAPAQTLSLQMCRDMAVTNNTKVKNARLDIIAASVRMQETMSEYFPDVSLNSFGFMALDPLLEVGVKDILGESGFSSNVQAAVDYLGERFGFPSVYTALQSGFSASVSVLQPIYAGGRIVNGNRLAALGKEAAMLQEDIIVREVLESIDRDYWRIVALEEKFITLEASEAFIDKLYEDVAAAVESGTALDTDLLQVELRRNELKKLRLSLKGGLRLAKMSLCNAIGQPYSLVKGLPEYIDDITLSERLTNLKPPREYYVPEDEVAESLAEARLLETSVKVKRLERAMAMGAALPQVGLGVSYGYTHAINSRFNGLLFAMVKIPLSDWGKTTKKVQRIDYDLQKAQNDREYLTSQLLLQVRSLWLDVTVAWENVALAREDMLLARKTAEMMADRYEAGLLTLSDLLMSQMQLRTRTDAYIEAMTGYADSLAAYVLRQ